MAPAKLVFDHYTQPAQRLGLGDTLSSGYVAWKLKELGFEPVFYCPHHAKAGLFERFPFQPIDKLEGLVVNPFPYKWEAPLALIQKEAVESVIRIELVLDPKAPLLRSDVQPSDYIAFHYTTYRGISTGKLAPRSLEPDRAREIIQFLKRFGKVVLLPGARVTGAEDEVVHTHRIPELIDTIAGAKLVVGTDSAPLHIANILGRPWVCLTPAHGTISIFSPRKAVVASSACPKVPCLEEAGLDGCPMGGPPYLCHKFNYSVLEEQITQLLQ